MMDYVKAGFYTALFFVVVFGLAGALTAFPVVTVTILVTASAVFLYYSILSAIRSQRKLNEIRARYE